MSGLSITLYHKPRGTAGKYVPIENNEFIRVSPLAGKRLRIMVHSNTDVSQVTVSVREWTGNTFQDRGLQGVEITHQQIGLRQGELPNELQLDVKLIIRGKLQFVITDGPYHKGTSVQFLATNTPQKKQITSTENVSSKSNSPPNNPPPSFKTPYSSTEDPPSFCDDSNGETSQTELKDISGGRPKKFQKIDGDAINDRALFYKNHHIHSKPPLQDLVDALSIINSLSGKKYEWREGTVFNKQTGGQKVIGLIAQQIREVLPELVHEDADGLLSVSYADLFSGIISAFNEYTQEMRVFREEVVKEIEDLKTLLQESQSLGGDNNLALQNQLEQLIQIRDFVKNL